MSEDTYQRLESLHLEHVAVAGGIRAHADQERVVYLAGAVALEGRINGAPGHVEIVPAYVPHTGEMVMQLTVRQGPRRPAAVDQVREVEISDLVLMDAPPPEPPANGTPEGKVIAEQKNPPAPADESPPPTPPPTKG